MASRVGQDTQEEHVVERWLEDQVVLMDVTLLMMTVCVVRDRLRSSLRSTPLLSSYSAQLLEVRAATEQEVEEEECWSMVWDLATSQ